MMTTIVTRIQFQGNLQTKEGALCIRSIIMC
jgi:hypothetical protein